MSINRWMDMEVVVHICNGILLSQKKEQNWVSSDEVNEPRAYYAEWSKSEGERQILYTNTYVWNLERVLMIPCAGQQRRHRHKEQTFGLSGERESGMIWKSSTETYTLPYAKQIVNRYLLYHAGSSNMVLRDNLEAWDGVGGRRHMYIYD